MNQILEGDIRTLANMESSRVITSREAKEIVELQKENEELKEMLIPFALHARALTKEQGGKKFFKGCDQNHGIYSHGMSYLTWGLFNLVLDWFNKENKNDE